VDRFVCMCCYRFLNSYDPIYFPANTYMKEMSHVHHGFDLSTCIGNRETLYGQMSCKNSLYFTSMIVHHQYLSCLDCSGDMTFVNCKPFGSTFKLIVQYMRKSMMHRHKHTWSNPICKLGSFTRAMIHLYN